MIKCWRENEYSLIWYLPNPWVLILQSRLRMNIHTCVHVCTHTPWKSLTKELCLRLTCYFNNGDTTSIPTALEKSWFVLEPCIWETVNTKWMTPHDPSKPLLMSSNTASSLRNQSQVKGRPDWCKSTPSPCHLKNGPMAHANQQATRHLL